jgi:hypothetical protein
MEDRGNEERRRKRDGNFTLQAKRYRKLAIVALFVEGGATAASLIIAFADASDILVGGGLLIAVAGLLAAENWSRKTQENYIYAFAYDLGARARLNAKANDPESPSVE